MIKAWLYDKGNWSEIDDPVWESAEDDEHLEEAAKRLRYHLDHEWGLEATTFYMKVFNAGEAGVTPYEFLIDCNANSFYGPNIFIKDLPSYLMFMREMEPLMRLSDRQQALDEENDKTRRNRPRLRS